MPRVCTICSHPESFAVNEGLVVAKQSNRSIAKQYGVHHSAVQRHREHVPQLLVEAARAGEVADADSLLDRLEALQAETAAVLDEVRGTDRYGPRLAAIREMRRNLEVIGEITKELNRTATLNLALHPEWLRIEAVIVGTLDRYPAARRAVVGALKELPNGEL